LSVVNSENQLFSSSLDSSYKLGELVTALPNGAIREDRPNATQNRVSRRYGRRTVTLEQAAQIFFFDIIRNQ